MPKQPDWHSEDDVRLDIGCGHNKVEGFLGLDRFPFSNVDLVCNFNKALPFNDNTFEYVIASHSLEHVRSLPYTIGEIARVSKDRALLTIIGPYQNTSLNIANPYHLQSLNEDSPRFWTNGYKSPLNEASVFPNIKSFGLAISDNSSWDHDIRVLKQEFFYFPAYRSLGDDVKRLFRQSLNNICDEILFHCVVVKSAIDPGELENISKTSRFVETNAIRLRREVETKEIGDANVFTSLLTYAAAIDNVKMEYTKEIENLKREIHELRCLITK